MSEKDAIQKVETVMVDTNKPYDQLTELEKLAVKDYGGNLTETISTLLYHTDGGLSPYIDGMTHDEALLTTMIMKQAAVAHYSEKGYHAEVKLQMVLESLDITEESLAATQKNPFLVIFWKHTAIMFAVLIGCILLTPLLTRILDPTTIGGIAYILVFILVSLVLHDLLKAFRFRKAKKLKAKVDKILEAKESEHREAL